MELLTYDQNIYLVKCELFLIIIFIHDECQIMKYKTLITIK